MVDPGVLLVLVVVGFARVLVVAPEPDGCELEHAPSTAATITTPTRSLMTAVNDTPAAPSSTEGPGATIPTPDRSRRLT